MKRPSSRIALAAAMTIVVLVLLTLAVASNSRTGGYYPVSQDGSEDYRRDRFKVDMSQAESDRFKIEAPTFETRVRATLRSGPSEASSPVPILVYHSAANGTLVVRVDDLQMRLASRGRETGLEVAAFIFALFGLFVLWWGRDRASLWLGVFCASFAASVFNHYGILPEWGMLVGSIVADVLFFASIYAFFQIAQTFALDAMRSGDPLRGKIESGREIVFGIVVFSAAVNFADTIGPTVFSEPVWPWLVELGHVASGVAIAITLGVGPIALLALGWSRASDSNARSRVRITLVTTLVAESGVIGAMWEQLAAHRRIGFDNAWFTLLAIPIGFLFSIPAYKVVEVKFVLNRILVFATMTTIIASIIVLTETVFDEKLPSVIVTAFGANPEDKTAFVDAIRFVVAFAIVLTFSRGHFILDEFFKALFFRRRDEAIKILHDFANDRAQLITSREELLEQSIRIVCVAVGARGSAFYETTGDTFSLARTCAPPGTHDDYGWPAKVSENDPAFTFLRGGRECVDLTEMDPTPSALPPYGVALRMAVSSRALVGALVVGERVKEGDGPYGREELAALEELARSVSEALFNLRAKETADFIRSVADGSIRGMDAVATAEAICERGLPGVDTGGYVRSPMPSPVPQILRPPT